MAVFLAADVEGGPFAIPVEGDRLAAFVLVVELLEVFVLDDAGAIFVEEAEGDFVFGVRLGEEVFESTPVVDVDSALALAVGNAKEDGILFTFDFVLERAASVSMYSLSKRCVEYGFDKWELLRTSS